MLWLELGHRHPPRPSAGGKSRPVVATAGWGAHTIKPVMRAEEEESRKRAEAEARERAEEPERLEAEAKRRAEEKKRRRRAEAAARQRAGEPERLEAEAKRREEQVQVFEAAKRASPIRMLAIAAGMAFTAGVIGLIIYTNTPPQAPEPTVQAPQPAPCLPWRMIS